VTPTRTALRQPLQERSRRTLEQLLVATERLLAKRSFEEISVEEIVNAARTSVGAFYARFRDKQALLPALYARYDRAVDARLEAAERRRSGETLEAAAAWIAREFVRTYREQPHLMRALALYVRAHPGEIDAETRARRKRQHEVFVRALLAHRARIRQAEPERAVARAIYFAVAALRDKALFGESTHAASIELDDDELVRECARLIVAYLTYEGS
jgi:AcrR family transcriptional regulator